MEAAGYTSSSDDASAAPGAATIGAGSVAEAPPSACGALSRLCGALSRLCGAQDGVAAPATRQTAAVATARGTAAAHADSARVELGGPTPLVVVSLLCRPPKLKRRGRVLRISGPRQGVLLFGDCAFDLSPDSRLSVERVNDLVATQVRRGDWVEQPAMAAVLVFEHTRAATTKGNAAAPSRLCLHGLSDERIQELKAAAEAERDAVRHWPAVVPDGVAFRAALHAALWDLFWQSCTVPTPAAHAELRALYLCEAWGTRHTHRGDAVVAALWRVLAAHGPRAAVLQPPVAARAFAAMLAAAAASPAVRALLLCVRLRPDADVDDDDSPEWMEALADCAEALARRLLAPPGAQSRALLAAAIAELAGGLPPGAKMCDLMDARWALSLQTDDSYGAEALLPAQLLACFEDAGTEEDQDACLARLLIATRRCLRTTPPPLPGLLAGWSAAGALSCGFWRATVAAAARVHRTGDACSALAAFLYGDNDAAQLRPAAAAALHGALALLPAALLDGMQEGVAQAGMPAEGADADALCALLDFCLQFEEAELPPALVSRRSALAACGAAPLSRTLAAANEATAVLLRRAGYGVALAARYAAAAASQRRHALRAATSPWMREEEPMLYVQLFAYARLALHIDAMLLAPLWTAFPPGGFTACLTAPLGPDVFTAAPARADTCDSSDADADADADADSEADVDAGADATPAPASESSVLSARTEPPVTMRSLLGAAAAGMPAYRGLQPWAFAADSRLFDRGAHFTSAALAACCAPARLAPHAPPDGTDSTLLRLCATLAVRLPGGAADADAAVGRAWTVVARDEAAKARLARLLRRAAARLDAMASMATDALFAGVSLDSLAACAAAAGAAASAFRLQGGARLAFEAEYDDIADRAPPHAWAPLFGCAHASAALLHVLGNDAAAVAAGERASAPTYPAANAVPLFGPPAVRGSAVRAAPFGASCVFASREVVAAMLAPRSSSAVRHGDRMRWHDCLWASDGICDAVAYDRLRRIVAKWTRVQPSDDSAATGPLALLAAAQGTHHVPPALRSLDWAWDGGGTTDAAIADASSSPAVPDRFLLIRVGSTGVSLGAALLLVYCVKTLKRKVYILEPDAAEQQQQQQLSAWREFLTADFDVAVVRGLTAAPGGPAAHASTDDDATFFGVEQLRLFHAEYVGTAGAGVTKVILLDERVGVCGAAGDAPAAALDRDEAWADALRAIAPEDAPLA